MFRRKKRSLRVNSVMILVVLSTHAELASATAGGARIGKRANYAVIDKISNFHDIAPNFTFSQIS